MFTPQSLLEYATSLEALNERVPTASRRWEMRREANLALLCGSYMEQRKIPQAAIIGPFILWAPKGGERVIVRKGARIGSTHDRLRRECGRAYSVKVHSFSAGHVWQEGDRIQLRQPSVTWVGSGGYWCWTTLDSVEPG
jgi:hypothetical protein